MKILIVRTDRIGEVLLSTPIITALKEKWPRAEITVMIRPEVKELIEDNPCVSEIIEYKNDIRENKGREGEIRVNRGKEGVIRAAFRLRKIFKEREFDIAIVVNPKKEFHLAAFLAGIPVRVGFNRKWAFFLTHKVKDLKFLAQKHEVEYNLDLVRTLGIEPKDKRPVLVVKDNLRDCFAPAVLLRKTKQQGLAMTSGDQPRPLIAIHPCTSNPKKQWPKTYFAKLGDLLMADGYNVVLVSGAKEARFAEEVIALMKNKPIDLTGKLNLRELAALFEQCKFLISGDSGPVHIAAAVGAKVIALFGAADPGSRPKRWGPYGEGHIVIAKERIEDILPSEVLAEIHRGDSSQ